MNPRVDNESILTILEDNDKSLQIRFTRKLIDVVTEKGSHVEIYETPTFGKALFLNGSIQITEAETHFYHSSCIAPLVFHYNEIFRDHVPGYNRDLQKDPYRLAFIGPGSCYSGILAKRLLPEVKVDLIDIDLQIIEICACYFDFTREVWTDKNTFNIIEADGYEYLMRDESNDRYDAVILNLPELMEGTADLYLDESISKMCSHCMRGPGAIWCCNANLQNLKYDEIFHQRAFDVYKTYRKIFEYCAVETVYIPSFASSRAAIFGSSMSHEFMTRFNLFMFETTFEKQLESAHVCDSDYIKIECHRNNLYDEWCSRGKSTRKGINGFIESDIDTDESID